MRRLWRYFGKASIKSRAEHTTENSRLSPARFETHPRYKTCATQRTQLGLVGVEWTLLVLSVLFSSSLKLVLCCSCSSSSAMKVLQGILIQFTFSVHHQNSFSRISFCLLKSVCMRWGYSWRKYYYYQLLLIQQDSSSSISFLMMIPCDDSLCSNRLM